MKFDYILKYLVAVSIFVVCCRAPQIPTVRKTCDQSDPARNSTIQATDTILHPTQFKCTPTFGYPEGSEKIVFEECTFSTIPFKIEVETSSQFSDPLICAVTYMNLKGANIKRVSQESFNQFKDIEKLDLSHNQIKILPPHIFVKHQNMRYLNLSFNYLQRLEPDSLHGLISIRILDLSHNQIRLIHPRSFKQLQSLNFLDLSYNRINESTTKFLRQPENLIPLPPQESNIKTLKDVISSNETRFDKLEYNSYPSTDLEQLLTETLQLETLNISNNAIRKITPEMFGSLSSLKHLDLSFNKIGELVEESFQSNSLLVTLRLQGNGLSELKSGDFRNLFLLEKLQIQSNVIEKIAPDSFKRLTNLRYINMDSNLIVSLNTSSSSEAIFSNIELKELILSRNSLKSMSNVFQKVSIHTLNLNGNVELILNKKMFAGIRKIHSLYIENCNVTHFPIDIFKRIPFLEELHMRNNSIQVIERETFQYLLNAKKIDLSYNEIKKLNNFFFYKTPSLALLNLSNNYIVEINDYVSEPILGPILQLDISSNLLTNIDTNILSNLISLNISYNRLTVINRYQWFSILRLKSFIATSNYMKEVVLEDIYFPWNLKHNCTVHLENNNITRIIIQNDTKRGKERFLGINRSLPSLQFYMAGNPFKCNCFAYELNKYLTAYNYSEDYVEYVDDLKCRTPIELKGKKLKELEPINFACDYNDDPTKFECGPDCDCTSNCTCFHRQYDNFRTVNCTNRGYRNLPVNIPLNTNSLDMSHNSLTSLLELNETRWENLTEIRVKNNSINSSDFFIPGNVNYLDLRNNKLTKFPTTVETHAIETRDFSVSLSENLWPCDCSALNLKTFLLLHRKKVRDFKWVTCILPNNSETVVINLNNTETCPPLQVLKVNTKTEVPVILYIFSILAVIFAILVSVFCYKYKLYILSFIYTHCNCCFKLFCCGKSMDENKCFDGFLSHSSDDWEVALAILEELEQKPPHYCLCLHQRNWMPGSYITDNIVYSVQNSRKTILIVSKTFVKSPYFYLEFQAAFYQTLQDKKDRLILILNGDMPDKSELTADVRFVLFTKSYLVWGERWFFEKLRYALQEENPLQVSEDSSSYLDSVIRLLRRREIPTVEEIEL